MKIKDLTAQRVSQEIKAAEKAKADFDARTERLRTRAAKLNVAIARHVIGAQREERKLRSLNEATLLVRGIPPTVSQLRESVFVLRDAVAREDITVAQARETKTRLSEAESQLRQTCAHPFVLEQAGCEGSSSMDNDDGYPAQRGCIVCVVYEVEIDYAQRLAFELLKDLDDRYVLRLTGKRDGLRPALQNLSQVRDPADLIQSFVTNDLQRYLDTLDASGA